MYGGSPVVVAFVKDDPAKAASLAAAIQKLTETHKDKNLKSFVVFMGGPELKDSIEKVAGEKGISIPLTFLPQGASASDVAGWKINPEARNTILIYNKRQIRSNFVNVDRASWPEVQKATAEALGQ